MAILENGRPGIYPRNRNPLILTTPLSPKHPPKLPRPSLRNRHLPPRTIHLRHNGRPLHPDHDSSKSKTPPIQDIRTNTALHTLPSPRHDPTRLRPPGMDPPRKGLQRQQHRRRPLSRPPRNMGPSNPLWPRLRNKVRRRPELGVLPRGRGRGL